MQVAGYRAIARLVSSGAGIGIVPRSAIEPANQGKVADVELTKSWAERDLRVCVRRLPTERNVHRDQLVQMLCGLD